jgi:two-component system, LytTR family, response regulator
MPEVDGFEVLEQLANWPLPVIIFVTAYDQYALKAFEVSALDYLLKPSTMLVFTKPSQTHGDNCCNRMKANWAANC